MYKCFIIVKNKYSSSSYFFHSSNSCELKTGAGRAYSALNDSILFSITTKEEHINKLINNLFYFFVRSKEAIFDEKTLLLILWYTNYYLKYNNIKYDIITDNQDIFKF